MQIVMLRIVRTPVPVPVYVCICMQPVCTMSIMYFRTPPSITSPHLTSQFFPYNSPPPPVAPYRPIACAMRLEHAASRGYMLWYEKRDGWTGMCTPVPFFVFGQHRGEVQVSSACLGVFMSRDDLCLCTSLSPFWWQNGSLE